MLLELKLKCNEVEDTISFCFYLGLDFLAVGSDSGRMVILEYNPSKNCFEKVGLGYCCYFVMGIACFMWNDPLSDHATELML